MHRALGPTRIRMPTDFPTAIYRSVYDHVSTRASADKYPEEWLQQYIGSALAVAYRFRACAKHSEAFVKSILDAGRTPDEHDRFTQDQELFNFFVTGFASLESLYYNLYAIAARLAPSDFPFATDSDYRHIDLLKAVNRFKRAFPGNLTDKLVHIQSSSQREEWEYARNVLIHRVASGGRVIFLWADTPQQPDEIRIGNRKLPLTVDAIRERRAWLAASLSDILTQTKLFVELKF